MWVYIVVCKDASSILAVFTNRQKAIEYIAEQNYLYSYEIIERFAI